MEETASEAKTEQTPKEDHQKTTSPQGKTKLTKKHFIITVVVAVLIIILATTGVYFWQQGNVNSKQSELENVKKEFNEQVASQSAQIENLEKENTDQKSRIAFLEKSLQEATASAQFELGELTVTTGSVKHYTSKQFSDASSDNNDFLLIDLTVKNDTDNALFFSTFDLKLKDENNKSYPYYTSIAPYLSDNFLLPSGKVELRDQRVNARETVSGTVIFFVPKTRDLFTLLYNTNEFTITAK